MVIPATHWGSGPTRLVMLHGFTGSSESFDHLRPQLEDRFHVTAPTLPGHGEAPSPRAGRPGFVETANAIAQMVHPGDVLFGYSMGARLALAAVLLGGAQPARLVLESGSPGLRRSHERALRAQEDERLARSIERDGIEAFVAAWESRPLFAGLKRLEPEQREQLRRRRSSHHPHGLAAALRGLGLGAQPSLWHLLPAVRVPLLCLTGFDDAKFTELGSKLSAAAPMGYHLALPAGHAPHLECPEAWAAALRDFATTPFPERLGRAEEAA